MFHLVMGAAPDVQQDAGRATSRAGVHTRGVVGESAEDDFVWLEYSVDCGGGGVPDN